MLASNSPAQDVRSADGIDPGSIDNRLSLDPNNPEWVDTIAKWKDGEAYQITATVTQISPGEFEVTSIASESEPSEDEEGADDEMEPSPGPNRAVRRMMMNEGA